MEEKGKTYSIPSSYGAVPAEERHFKVIYSWGRNINGEWVSQEYPFTSGTTPERIGEQVVRLLQGMPASGEIMIRTVAGGVRGEVATTTIL